MSTWLLLFMPSWGPGTVSGTVHTNPNTLHLPLLGGHKGNFHPGEKQLVVKGRKGRNDRIWKTFVLHPQSYRPVDQGAFQCKIFGTYLHSIKMYHIIMREMVSLTMEAHGHTFWIYIKKIYIKTLINVSDMSLSLWTIRPWADSWWFEDK